MPTPSRVRRSSSLSLTPDGADSVIYIVALQLFLEHLRRNVAPKLTTEYQVREVILAVQDLVVDQRAPLPRRGAPWKTLPRRIVLQIGLMGRTACRFDTIGEQLSYQQPPTRLAPHVTRPGVLNLRGLQRPSAARTYHRRRYIMVHDRP